MAHYALLDENNIVVNIITGIDEDELIEGIDTETWYGNFHNLICKRASYNTIGGIHLLDGTPFRKNYPQIGYIYDNVRDAFIPPKPENFPSWILSEEKCIWEPPIPKPEDAFDEEDPMHYGWDEETISWVLISTPN